MNSSPFPHFPHPRRHTFQPARHKSPVTPVRFGSSRVTVWSGAWAAQLTQALVRVTRSRGDKEALSASPRWGRTRRRRRSRREGGSICRAWASHGRFRRPTAAHAGVTLGCPSDLTRGAPRAEGARPVPPGSMQATSGQANQGIGRQAPAHGKILVWKPLAASFSTKGLGDAYASRKRISGRTVSW